MNNQALRILLFIGVIIVTLGGGIVATISLETALSREVLKNEKVHLQNTAEDVVSQLQLLFDQYAQSITYLSRSSDVITFLEGENPEPDLTRTKIDTVRADRDEITIFVTDVSGQILLSTDSRLEGESLRTNFDLSRTTQPPVTYYVGVGQGQNEVGVYLLVPVQSLGGDVLGGIALEVNPVYLENIENTSQDHYGALYVTDDSGLVIASSDKRAILKRVHSLPESSADKETQTNRLETMPLLIDSAEILDSIYNKSERNGVIEDSESLFGDISIVAFTHLPERPFTVLVGSNQELLTYEYTRLYPFIIGILILCGIGASGLLLFFVDRLIRPYEELEKSARALLAGETDSIRDLKDSQLTHTIRGVLEMADARAQEGKKYDKQLELNLQVKENELSEQQDAILNVLEDIAEAKESAEASATDLQKFKLAVDGVADVVVITDKAGKIIYANPVTESTTGFTVKECLGKKPSELWGGKMSIDYYKKMWKTIAHDKKSFRGEVNNVRKDGNEYIAHLHISPLLNQDKEVEFYVGVQRDITRERQIDRMKTEFISLASHQLRTPLSAMKWYLEMILDGDVGPLSRDQKKYIDEVYSSNQRMIELVNSLLSISRIESGRIIVEPLLTDIHTLIDEVIEEVQVLSDKKKQKIQVRVANEVPKIMLDPKLIRNVYLNLLTNAVKYSPEGSTIKVHVRMKEESVYSEVIDQGYGIPEEQQERIFTKFFRASNITSNDTEGTGLGLYLVRAIIISSGGIIGFKSNSTSDKSGTGSTFWFTIPVKGMKKKKGEVRVDD